MAGVLGPASALEKKSPLVSEQVRGGGRSAIELMRGSSAVGWLKMPGFVVCQLLLHVLCCMLCTLHQTRTSPCGPAGSGRGRHDGLEAVHAVNQHHACSCLRHCGAAWR